jgi:AcrR family transcriptional regulator
MTDQSVFVNLAAKPAARYAAAMPKISKEASARRRAQILNAARLCFAKDGVHVSVDEICARAGVSKGAFYLYFDSKDAAIEALAEDHEKFLTAFSDIKSVQALIGTLAQHTSGREVDSNRLELEAWTYSLRLPTLRAAMQRNVERLQQALTRSVRAIEGENSRLVSEAAPAGEILSVFALGMIVASVLGEDRASKSSEAALKHLVGALIRPRPAKRRARRAAKSGA